MSEWALTIIGQAPLHIGDGNYSSKYPKASDFIPKGIPFISASDFQNGRISSENLRYISARQHETLRKGHLEAGDVLIVTRGNGIGKVAFVDETYSGANINAQLVLLRPSNEEIDNRFLYYLLSSRVYYELLKSYSSGSAQPQLPIGSLVNVEITYPDIYEQRAIAHILGSLDDKIEANRRLNDTLEATARAIFKSWFVDFDPVHANANGEAPIGMDAATAALFPDRFEDSDLGPIPAGWRVGTFDEGIEIIGGGTPKTSIPEYWDGDIPWFSVKDVPTDIDVFVIETEKMVTQTGVDNSSTNVLPELTTIISARGTVGKLALTGVEMAMNQSCYAVRGLGGYPDFFTYFHLKTRIAELQQQTHGTVFDTITRNTFSNLQTVLPHSQIAQLYDSVVESMLEQIRNNVFESRTLAETRDALLPKLVSGALRVGEIDRYMEDVTE